MKRRISPPFIHGCLSITGSFTEAAEEELTDSGKKQPALYLAEFNSLLATGSHLLLALDFLPREGAI